MRRMVVVALGTVAILSVLAFTLTAPALAGRRGMLSGAGDPVTIEQAREQAAEYLDDIGFDDLVVAEVMEFSNHFYVAAVDPATGDGAFELLVSRDGRAVDPEPTMMWNTEYNPMLGGRGAAFHSNMMRGGMMSGGMSQGMMGSGDTDRQQMMDPSQCQGMMGPAVDPGRQLDQPLTTDESVTVAQDWLDANLPGLTVSEPIAFPGYVTLHTERDGQIVGMLSFQTTTGAVWEHTWHGDFVTIEHGA